MTRDNLIKIKNFYDDAVSVMKIPVYIARIPRTIRAESYYPEKTRKSNLRMFLDNLLWILKEKEAHYFYNASGQDIKGWRHMDDFLSVRTFSREREFGNSCVKEGFSYSYLAILRDKYVFSAYLSSTIGADKVIPTVALYSNEEIFLLSDKSYMSVDDFFSHDLKMFCKVNGGERSEGVFLLERKDAAFYLNNQPTTLETIKSLLKGSKFIFQNVLQQHPALSTLNSGSVNSIRVVTVQGVTGKINIFLALLRLGATKDSFVDNTSAGGIGIRVNQNGILDKYGFQDQFSSVKLEKHPISNITFEDYQLPYWQEVTELVEAAHKQFYYVQSVGWDVAITPTGPVLIEGNDNWAAAASQVNEGGLKKRWHALKNS